MPILNLQLKTSVVRGRIELRPNEKKTKSGTKVNIRTVTITKTQLNKHYREYQVAYPYAEQLCCESERLVLS